MDGLSFDNDDDDDDDDEELLETLCYHYNASMALLSIDLEAGTNISTGQQGKQRAAPYLTANTSGWAIHHLGFRHELPCTPSPVRAIIFFPKPPVTRVHRIVTVASIANLPWYRVLSSLTNMFQTCVKREFPSLDQASGFGNGTRLIQ